MSKLALLWIVTVLYVVQTGVLVWQREWPSAIIFFGYALANAGLIWSLS